MMAWLGSRREIEGLLRREQEAAAISEAEGSVEFTVAKWTMSAMNRPKSLSETLTASSALPISRERFEQ